MSLPTRQEIIDMTTQFEQIRDSVTYKSGQTKPVIDKHTHTVTFPERVTLTSLQAGVKQLESYYSQNCNCLTNPQCCQTCQICQVCQSCQSCESGWCENNCLQCN